LGRAVSLEDFKGGALAFTFVFTRCPFPTFCPRMSGNFAEAQKKLQTMPNAPTNWHLLTISFDPEFDTPPVLKSYAESFHADSRRWNFVTGDLIDVTALAEQFGTTAEFDDPPGGIFLWIKLPDQVDTLKLAAAALAAGVAINPGPEWSTDKAYAKSRMRLCFASPSAEEIRQGVAMLADLCRREFGVPERSANVEQTQTS
jgi:cytochrome oxidase Cu insertion factor (SCO1/SenC/PrrC family)